MSDKRIRPKLGEGGNPVCDFGEKDCPFYDGMIGGEAGGNDRCRHPDSDGPVMFSCVPALKANQPRRTARLMKVYTVVDRPGSGKGTWLEIGVASRCRDGSISGKLDATPVNGTIQLADEKLDEERAKHGSDQRERIVMLEGVVRELLDGRPGCGVDALIADYDEKASRS